MNTGLFPFLCGFIGADCISGWSILQRLAGNYQYVGGWSQRVRLDVLCPDMLGLRPLSVLIHELKQLNVFKGVGFWVHI